MPLITDAVGMRQFQPRTRKVGRLFGGKTRKRIPLCCNATRKDRVCRRGSDGKIFSLHRQVPRDRCLSKSSQRASCAPYLGGTRREKKTRRFLYHPDNPTKSFDVYIDKNPKDTIPIKYSTINDVKCTIQKLERLYKRGDYGHKRIWQVAMIMKVRLEAIKKHHPRVKTINQRVAQAQKYFKFLGERSKEPDKKKRKKMVYI